MERPETRYVEVGEAEVAYQIVGQGPPDVVYVAGVSHIDLRWDDPVWAAFLERLASFSRLILFDRRGTGVSDAVPDTAMPTWEGVGRRSASRARRRWVGASGGSG
jgi:pimeloyl-ACP methyl ester carboxylesterase